MGSGDRDHDKHNEILVGGYQAQKPTSDGLMLAQMNTTNPRELCYIADFQVFDLIGDSIFDYINNATAGTWFLGITKNLNHRQVPDIKERFLDEVGIDMTILETGFSKMALTFMKGDKSTARVSADLKFGGPVLLAEDITERKDGKIELFSLQGVFTCKSLPVYNVLRQCYARIRSVRGIDIPGIAIVLWRYAWSRYGFVDNNSESVYNQVLLRSCYILKHSTCHTISSRFCWDCRSFLVSVFA